MYCKANRHVTPIIYLIGISLLCIVSYAFSINAIAARQERLDAALILALKANNSQQVMSCLQRGASANAIDRSQVRAGLKYQLVELWRRITGTPLQDRASDQESIPALAVLYDLRTGHACVENPTIIRALLSHGAKPNFRTKSGVSILHATVIHNHLCVTAALLKYGASPNSRDNYGATPAFYASEQMLRVLLRYGANLNAQDNFGKTPLLLATANRKLPVIKCLLECSADPNIADNMSRTPLSIALGQRSRFPNDRGATLLFKYSAHLKVVKKGKLMKR